MEVIALPDLTAVPSAVTLAGGADTVTTGSAVEGNQPPTACLVIEETEPPLTAAVAVAVVRVAAENVTVGELV